MSKPISWRVPLAALALVGVLLLTVAPLAVAAVDIDAERARAVDTISISRCGDRP